MKLAEKTLELSIIAQLTQRLSMRDAIWFGLTQRQEKKWGFDAASRLGGLLYLLQFKASNTVMASTSRFAGSRRFKLPHPQLDRLQVVAQAQQRRVFYVFPDLGKTSDLVRSKDLITRTWLLDVAQLRYPYPPTPSDTHYAYMSPPNCEIRSEPSSCKLISIVELVQQTDVVPNARAFVSYLREADVSTKGLRLYGLLLPR